MVRISDIIAYLGKDRQDASKARLPLAAPYAEDNLIGQYNSDIITSLVNNIIKNSADRGYIKIDDRVFDAMNALMEENDRLIYQSEEVIRPYYDVIRPMMEKLYIRFREDIQQKNYDSIIFKHHINERIFWEYCHDPKKNFVSESPDNLTMDFIASMTDDYFIDVFRHLFPDDPLNDAIEYVEYFDPRYMGREKSETSPNA